MSSLLQFTLLTLFTLILSALCKPTVLVRKLVVTNPIGQGFDMKVDVHIHNIGDEPIYNVTVLDQWSNYFEVSPKAKDGNVCHYDSIAAHANVTCKEIYVPNRNGAHYVAPAVVQYLPKPDSEEPVSVFGHPFPDVPLNVFPRAVYKRLFTSHFREMIVFFLLISFAGLFCYSRFISFRAVNDARRSQRRAKPRNEN